MSPTPSRLRRRLGHGGLSLLVLAASSSLLWSASSGTAFAGPAGPEPQCADGTCTVDFDATGDLQTWVVPRGVTSVTSVVSGAAGGAIGTPAAGGGATTGTFGVVAGQELSLVVGEAGEGGSDEGAGASATYGGGGAGGNNPRPETGGSSGGGGSFVFGPDGVLLAAGGGGGSSTQQQGGAGGAAGVDASQGLNGVIFTQGGYPGTVLLNGPGGAPNGGAATGEPFSPQSLPTGGSGGNTVPSPFPFVQVPGGGGGGGYHAGGGGGGPTGIIIIASGQGAGGGGGAGYAARVVTNVSGEAGVQAGDGHIVLSYADVPSLAFTSDPGAAVVGGTYTPVVTSTGPNPVTFSVDAATTNGACTVDGTTVTLVHAGTCAVAADQAADADHPAAHVVQSFTVAKAAQTITFAPLPASGDVGDVLTLAATATGSAGPVTFALGAGTACTLDGTTLTLTKPGSCVVTASLAGDADHTAAQPVDQTVTVAKVVTTTTVSTDPASSVYGQAVTATAKVTGASAGAVQFSVDGTDVGDPVALDGDGTVSTDLPADLAVGGRTVKAAFVATDTDTYTSSSSELTLAVAKAQTATKIKISANEASATVTALAPGSGTPEGTVVFTFGDLVPVPVPLVHGRATLPRLVPVDTDVRVTYAGDAFFAGSSDSTARRNPTITASVTSEDQVSPFGWYRSPVTVSFTCTPGSAALTDDCPDPVTLDEDGAAQGVSKTITAEDGGVATVSVTDINIDQVKPDVTPLGVEEGDRFFATAPVAGCIASDDLSGVQLCAATSETKGKAVTYSVFAADRAGNVTTDEVHATTYVRGIVDAPYADGVYTVKAGQTYTLVAKSSKQARVLKPTTGSKKPTSASTKFKRTGKDTWALGYTIGSSLKVGKTYNLGIQTSAKYEIKIRVIA